MSLLTMHDTAKHIQTVSHNCQHGINIRSSIRFSNCISLIQSLSNYLKKLYDIGYDRPFKKHTSIPHSSYIPSDHWITPLTNYCFWLCLFNSTAISTDVHLAIYSLSSAFDWSYLKKSIPYNNNSFKLNTQIWKFTELALIDTGILCSAQCSLILLLVFQCIRVLLAHDTLNMGAASWVFFVAILLIIDVVAKWRHTATWILANNGPAYGLMATLLLPIVTISIKY